MGGYPKGNRGRSEVEIDLGPPFFCHWISGTSAARIEIIAVLDGRAAKLAGLLWEVWAVLGRNDLGPPFFVTGFLERVRPAVQG